MSKKEDFSISDRREGRDGWITKANGEVIHYVEKKGMAMRCPSYGKSCVEDSLSVGWMISFQHDLGEDLHCFQCDTPIGVFTTEKPIIVRND